MDETMLAFTAIGGILVIGVLGELMLKRYKVSPALILLGIGYVLGPGSGILNMEMLRGMQNLIGPLALMILLFDSGTRMNIRRIFHEGARGVGMGVIASILIIALVAVLWAALYGDFFVGVLLGAVFAGGASGPVVNPLAQGMKLDEETQDFLGIENAASDVVSVVLVITLTASLVSGVFDAAGIAGEALNEFLIATFAGIAAGAAWILVSTFARGAGFFHMLTFAVALLLYVVVQLFGGNGAIGILVFGIMLGNMGEIGKITGIDAFKQDEEMLKFQDEISFMVRTFFFVFLGALMSFGDGKAMILGVVIVVLIYVARRVAIWAVSRGNPVLQKDATKIAALLPRDFGTAVMATYPAGVVLASVALMNPESYESAVAQAGIFPEIAFVAIVTSILFTTVESYLRTREDELWKTNIKYDRGKALEEQEAVAAREAKEKRANLKRTDKEELEDEILEDETKGKKKG